MPNDRIEVIDMTDKLLTFIETANHQNEAVDQSFELWQQHVGFAAVPPGEAGQQKAFQLFKAAYHRYTGCVLDQIKAFKADEKQLYDVLAQVKWLLGYEKPVEVVVIYYVGFFENNAFMSPYHDGRLALCLPVENTPDPRREQVVLAREFTHIVHAKTSGSKGAWLRPLATVLMQEGLALRASKAVVPGLDEGAYLGDDSSWFAACVADKTDIINGVKRYLDNDDTETLLEFTMGRGTTGREREAYYVAWVLFDALLKRYTLSQLAHIREDKIVTFIKNAYDLIEPS